MAKRLMICDDSMLMRKMVAEALIDDGWEVVAEASDGAEAFDLYQQHRPDKVHRLYLDARFAHRAPHRVPSSV